MNCKHGIELEWCALCSPRTVKNQVGNYALVESVFKGNPVMEILENGQPFPFDAHFRFGCGKASLILACKDLIEEFAYGSTTLKPQTLHARLNGFDIDVSIEEHSEFVHSTGEVIYTPWLSLRVAPAGTPHISFGARKALALCALYEKIEAWARRKCK